MVDLTDYLWIVWIALIFIFVTIELVTLDFTFAMIAVGSLAGLGANILGAPWWLQIIAAAVFSMLLLLIIRPILLRVMRRGADPTPSNLAALIGMGGRVVAAVGDSGGLVRLANGETWTARLADAQIPPIPIDNRVRVTAIDGSTAVVTPESLTTPDPTTERAPLT